LLAQTTPGLDRGSPYLIIARTFEDKEFHPSDDFLVDRELTFFVVRDASCDRVITYKQVGDACGPGGSAAIYDWRKLSSKQSRPDEGVALQCYRADGAIPEFALDARGT
jgi:hypothetical protein